MSGEGFRGLITSLAPTRLQRPWGQKFLYVMGLVADGVYEWARQGVNARFPSIGTPTALPYIFRDRQLFRGFAEPDAAARERVRRALDDLLTIGNPETLLRQLRAYLFGFDAMIATVTSVRGTWDVLELDGAYKTFRQQFNWNWQNETPQEFSRAWVIIWPDPALWQDEGVWGVDADEWGDGGTWGTTATADQVTTVREIVRQCKGAGRHVVNIIIAFDPTSFAATAAGGAPMPDGTWKYDGKYVGGTVVPARLGTARYWDGTSHKTIETS